VVVTPNQSARIAVEAPSDVRAEAWRVALLVRDLRRAASSQRFRHRLYGDNVLDPGQHDALDAVVSLGRARMHELADWLRVDRSTATRTVERLENLGLVERRSDLADSRYVTVVATRTGRRRQRALAERSRHAFDVLFDRFDDEALTVLGELLEQLVATFDDFIATGDETSETVAGE
jgi:DNA-binding MarR family transcriptional regulator